MKRLTALFVALLIALPLGCHYAGAGEKISLIVLTEENFDKLYFCEHFDAELIYTYESICAFAVSVNKSDVEKIKKYEGIKSISEDVSVPGPGEVEEVETPDIRNRYFTDGDETDEYRGEGALVAVIDAGCNVSHPTFGITTQTVALSCDDVSEILRNNEFNAEKLSAGFTGEDAYQNAKFPFAFDYGDGDSYVYGASHGTGVCSVLAGNGGSFGGETFYGALPEAQLVIMKVQDSSGGISISDMLAALEDAMLLGVDGINISIGTVSGFGGTPGEAVFEAAINKAREKGIFVSISAGNSGMLTAEGGYSETSDSFNRPLNSNTDYGVMGSPAVYKNAVAVGSSTENGAPSVFSSWGCGPSMELKPDICASGNAVTVALNSGFTVSRGTSYSSPLLLGNAIKVKHKYGNREDADSLAEKLIVNTADIMRNGSIPVSPRKQGGGKVNVLRALGAKCVIYGEDGKPKLSLKDNLGASFSGEFTVENISEETASYTPSIELITDGTNGERITGKSVTLKNTAVFSPSSVTLEPGERMKVTFQVQADENEIEKNEKLFPNGFFLEGFISLKGDELLSIPFMGYYGSWTSAPVFIPPTVKYGFGFATVMMNRSYTFENTYYYGNPFFPSMGLSNPHLNIENIAFSPNGDKLLDTANIFAGFYRNALSLKLTFKDEKGNTVYEINRAEIPKGLGLSTAAHTDYRWNGNDMRGNPCPEGQYYMTAEATVAYEGAAADVITLPVYIDRTAPVLERAEVIEADGRTYFEAYFSDNNKIQVTAISGEGFSQFCYEPSQTGAYRFDITGISADEFELEAFDYALNSSLDKITVADEYRVYYKGNRLSRVKKTSKAYINGNINDEYELENEEDGFKLLIWNKNMMPVF